MESSKDNEKVDNTNEEGEPSNIAPKNSEVNTCHKLATNSCIVNTCSNNTTQLKDISSYPCKPQAQSINSNSELVDTRAAEYNDLNNSLVNSATSITSSECSSENSHLILHETRVSNQKGRVTDEIGPDGVWKVRTYTGYIVTLHIDLNMGKPQQFSSESAEVMWYTANEINMMRLKHQIQRGEYFPNDAIIDIDPSPIKIPPVESRNVVLESEEKRREKLEAWKSFKVAALQKEAKIVESAITLRECFSECEPQLERGLEVLDTFPYQELSNLTLKKYPFVVYTLQNLCTYEQPIINQLEDTKEIIGKVREKAKSLYCKIQTLFNCPSRVDFEGKFKEQYSLLWKMYGFSAKRIQEIVKDPTLQIL